MTTRPLSRRRFATVALGTLLALPSVAAAAPQPNAADAQPFAVSWGSNGQGQLGDATFTERHTAGPVIGLGPAAVAAGFFHSLALLDSGTVRAWGDNTNGQLGDGTNQRKNVPVNVVGLSGVRAVAAGSAHSLALLTDGTVRAWGFNGSGQLGNGTTTSSNVPVEVAGLRNVQAIAAGGAHSLALLHDGTVRAWGSNNSGQLGNGATGGISTRPVTVVKLDDVWAVAAGGAHSLALLEDGTVRSWGSNEDGTLGNGTDVEESGAPVRVTGLSGVQKIAGGGSHSLALREDGTIRSWGANGQGQLGIGTAIPFSNVPVTVVGVRDARAVAAGPTALHSLALIDADDDVVLAWGWNISGQLGDGITTSRSTPVPVQTGLRKVSSIAGGAAHTLAAG